jgi:hypothetical protein
MARTVAFGGVDRGAGSSTTPEVRTRGGPEGDRKCWKTGTDQPSGHERPDAPRWPGLSYRRARSLSEAPPLIRMSQG